MNARVKLSSKNQVVIPRAVRERLSIGAGDELVFRVEGDAIVVERAPAADDPFGAFHEWASDEDDAAYADL